MKPIILLLISLCLTIMLQAQVSKTVNSTAGSLSTALTATELSTVTNLTITGTIDARDFKTMRDDMPLLSEVDLSGTTIVGDVYSQNKIPSYAFDHKKSLTSFIFPSSVTAISSSAFDGCSGLKGTLSIPSTVTTIGYNAFHNCSGFTGSLTIPSSVTYIGNSAFYNCSGFTGTLNIPSSISSIESSAFYNCSGLTGSLTIPSSVTSIGSSAFGRCSGFRGALTIPSSVISIGNGAFSSCYGLTGTLNIPSSLTTIENGVFSGCGFTGTLIIPSSVTSIGKGAFSSCGSLTGTLTIPESVTYIGDNAFKNCTGLTRINIPRSVTSIGDQTFEDCRGLMSVTIPSTVVSIGDYAFSNCSALTSIYSKSTIPVDLNSSLGVFVEVNKTTCTLYVPFETASRYAATNQWQDFLNIVEETNGFLLSSNLVNVAAADRSTASVEVSANVEWTASSDQTWLTVSPPSETGDHTLTFTAKVDPLNTTRISTVTVSAIGFESQTIVITQEANEAPIANAGLDQSVLNGTLVTLDGAASSDTNSDPITFVWTAPVEITLSSKTAAKPTFTAPEVTANTDFTFSLVVNDGTVNSIVNEVVITVKPMNQTPSANAGNDQTVNERVMVTLDGSASSDSDSDQLTYLWTAPAGITLSSKTADKPTFTAPEVTTNTNFTFSLVVNDRIVDSPVDEVVITVMPTGPVYVTAGGLKALITTKELASATNLKLIGTIDARDFQTMRDDMPLLAEVDLSGTTVVEYYGPNGTVIVWRDPNQMYGANAIPAHAFYDIDKYGGNASLTSLIFPSSITSIGYSAFSGCLGLTGTLTIPSSVTSIGDNAFSNCSGLTGTLTIPPSVNFIGPGTFKNCSGFTGVLTLPSAINSIGADTFGGCNGFTGTLTIPPAVSSIGAGAFRGCSGFTGALTIPSTVNSIGVEAFGGCSGFTGTLTIPPAVSSIGAGAFRGCSGFTGALTIPSTVNSIGAESFWGCSGFTGALTIPPAVNSIRESAFSSCSGLTSLFIPSSVTYIGPGAFKSCFSLSSIFANSVIPINLTSSPDVFSQVNKSNCILYVPYGSSALYAAANQWRDFLNIEEMPGFKLSASTANVAVAEGSTTTVEVSANIAWTASSDQIWLTVSPNSGTGNHALTFTAKANPLTTTRTATVTVSSTGVESRTIVVTQEILATNKVPVANAGSDQTVFKGTLVTLDGSASSDPDSDPLTYLWTAPTGITLSSETAAKPTFTAPEVTANTDFTFSLIVNDGTVNSPADTVVITVTPTGSVYVTAGGLKALFTPEKLTEITKLKLTGTIDARDFKTMRDDMPLLAEVDLSGVMIVACSGEGPYGNTDYSANEVPVIAFFSPVSHQGKTSLSSIIFPSSFNSIRESAFNGCIGLTSVTIPFSVTTIGGNAFINCSGLMSVSISSSVTSIGVGGFMYCTKLTSVSIPSSVTSIWNSCFAYCTGLSSIYANSVIPINLSASPNVFYQVNKSNCILYVPSGSSALYAAADQWKDFLNIVEISPLMTSATTANVAAPEGSTAAVEVSATVAWTASSDQTWLTVSPNSGTGNHALTFTAKANPLTTTRTATVTVSATGVESRTIVVTQEAGIANKLPVANAGSDQTVNEGSLVTLNGSGSYDPDNNSLSFPWTAPGNIQLNSPIAIKVTVTGPPVTTTRSHDFSLMLYDGSPTATPGNNSFKFNWTIPSGITFSSSTVSIITISPPNTTHANYTFAIKVLDGSNTSDPWHNGMTYFTIPPTDFVMSPTTIVKLSISGTESTTLTNQNFSMEVSDATPGSGTVLLTKNWPMPAGTNLGPTTDVILTITSPNGASNPDYKFLLAFKNGATSQNQLTYKWTPPAGILLSSTTDPNPTFTAPEVSTVTDYIFYLVVNDGTVDSPPDVVVIRVNNNSTYQRISSVWDGNSLDHMNINIYSADLLVLVNPNDLTSSQEMENSAQFKCYPNPFAEEINIEIENPQQNKVSVSIFNLAGQCIKNLINGNTDKLVYLTWNGTNDLGHQVTPGVYVCRVNNRSKQIIFGR